MSDIKTFPFDKTKLESVKEYEFGKNWPVVYLLENGKELYVGETISAISRLKQHHDNPERRKLNKVHIITDEEFNKSAALDIESWLIQYMSADGIFKLQNGNSGLQNHNYFDRERYEAKFDVVWDKLKKSLLVKQDLVQIKNSDLFKYSPYKTLTEDQLDIVERLFKTIKNKEKSTFLINGKPGTGKTILAVFLVKYLKEQKETKDLKVGLVLPMTPIRNTVKKVFKNIKDLKANMVIGPNEVVDGDYDILIVDEAHRLRRRKNITNYGSFDQANKKLGLDKDGNELNWIMKSSDHQIFLYDENQSVRPSDVRSKDFKNIKANRFSLMSQQRVDGGDEYIKFIEDIFDLRETSIKNFSNYEFAIYNNIEQMVKHIKQKNKEHDLCRLVAGYAWEWRSKNNPDKYDIDINGTKLRWNSVTQNWVNSKNAINEVGCIHTVQGYDLNYVGVIIGPELSYDPKNKKFIINRDKYKDSKGHVGVTDPEELERYIINIYKTIMTRGILGTYVYVVDKNLREYLKEAINKGEEDKERKSVSDVINSNKLPTVRVPLFGSAPCGDPMFAEDNIEDYVEVDKKKVRPGYDYFVLRAVGDSMNLAGINDGDLVLCRRQLKADTGDRVVALLGDDATIKMYDKKDGRRILLPKSTNKTHKPISPEEGDSVQGIVQEVLYNE